MPDNSNIYVSLVRMEDTIRHSAAGIFAVVTRFCLFILRVVNQRDATVRRLFYFIVCEQLHLVGLL